MDSLRAAGITTIELRDSFRVCERALDGTYSLMSSAAELLPLQVRPYVRAVVAFAVRTDYLADEGDPTTRSEVLARWCEESLAELGRGCSEHPVRRAFVHAVNVWGLDVAVIEELLAAVTADSATLPDFATFADLRRYLRGVAGTVAELCTPMLDPVPERGAARGMSLLGEAVQLVENIQDFSLDLSRGRCYLPKTDLDEHGLSLKDLGHNGPSKALDAVIRLQVTRARELVEQGSLALSAVHPSSQPFLQGCVSGVRMFLDEAESRKSAVFWEQIPIPDQIPIQVLVGPLSPPTLDATPPRTQPPGLVQQYATSNSTAASLPAEVPNHVAVIMDGNRRWAAARGLPTVEGHRAGASALRTLIDSALGLGTAHLSVFAFSTENWQRADEELDGLMELFTAHIRRYVEEFHPRGVRMRWCGRRDRVSERVRRELEAAEALTMGHDRLSLTFCVDYGGRTELLDAAQAMAADTAAGRMRLEEMTERDMARRMYVPDLPDVDLLIRTSGEQRISNFLPWHLAYAELVFTDVYWPDFTGEHLVEAITEYAHRQRRFGATAPAEVTA